MLQQLKTIQSLFDTKALEKAYIFDDSDTSYQSISIGFKTNIDAVILLCTQRNNKIIKEYKTLDSAYTAIIKIGFKEVKIIKQ